MAIEYPLHKRRVRHSFSRGLVFITVSRLQHSLLAGVVCQSGHSDVPESKSEKESEKGC
jgi:hypothetical protein